MRVVIGVLGGIAVAVLCIFVIEAVGHSVFPVPPGIDPYNPADVERLMAALPAGAFAFVVVGWFIGTLLGASVPTGSHGAASPAGSSPWSSSSAGWRR